MQLVIKDEIPAAADESRAYQTKQIVMVQPSAEEPAMQDEAEQQSDGRQNEYRNCAIFRSI